jgi:hypothetical protein
MAPSLPSRRFARCFPSFAAAFGAVLLAAGSAHATAIAQSVLIVSDLTLRQGTGDATVGGAFGAGIAFTAARDLGNVFVDLDGTTEGDSDSANGTLNLSECIGVCNPGNHHVGSTATLFGNLVASSVDVETSNSVSLLLPGEGSAQSNVSSTTEFLISIASVTSLELNFDADAFLRAALGQPGIVAAAGHGWTVSLSREVVPGVFVPVFSWSPDGLPGGVSGGTEYLDPFSLQMTLSTVTTADLQFDADVFFGTSQFQAETAPLAIGSYKLSILQTGSADAEFVPEPGSFALLGCGLLGLWLRGRRRQD